MGPALPVAQPCAASYQGLAFPALNALVAFCLLCLLCLLCFATATASMRAGSLPLCP